MSPPARSAVLLARLHESARRSVARLRLAVWRAEGARLHGDVRLFGRVTLIGDPRHLRIGPGSSLNEGVHLGLRDTIWIGADVHISSNVQLHTGELVAESVPRVHRSEPIVIEDHAWIAAGSVIGAGVRVGRGAVVAAGAVVVHDVEPMTLVAGVPARVVRSLGGPGDPPLGGDEVSRRRFRSGNGRTAAADR
jgi:acetyltransferase-like isoleucine patch superfamily enzyme